MFLCVFLLLFLFFLVIILVERAPVCVDDFEEEETEEIIERTEERLQGNLARQIDGNSLFVIDPVDQQKIFVNSTDDRYEDQSGKIWRPI